MEKIPTSGVQIGSYRYQKLTGHDSIRLLLLSPASPDNRQLRCSLVHTTLADCECDIVEHYVALSYVWGNPERVRTIVIDGTEVGITENLYAALRDLQDQTRSLRLWVDAVCINQNDDEEKSHQVAIMQNIYALARVTVIYLGPLDIETEQLLRNSNGSLALSDTLSNTRLASIILSRPWYRRVWVFQELVLSREPWVQHGRYRWSWDVLSRFLEDHMQRKRANLDELSIPDLENPISLSGQITDAGYQSLAGMQTARELYRNSKESHNLTIMRMLPSRRGLGCSDPRDMIYAHRNLAKAGYHVDLRPDYTKTCAQVYEDFAYYEIEHNFSYDILCHVGHNGSSTRPQGLASWAPDWTTLKTTAPLLVDGLAAQALLAYREKNVFAIHHTWVENPRILILLGCVMDAVVQCSNPLSGRDIPPQKRLEFSNRLRDAGYNYHDMVLHGARPRVQLYMDIYTEWRNFVGDGMILSPQFNKNNMQTLKSFSCAFDDYDRDSAETYISKCFQVVDYLVGYFLPEFDKAMVDGRALARLASGRLALVPEDAQEGDLVFRLPGLYLSRDTYRHIAHGPCFLTRPVVPETTTAALPRGKIISAFEHMEEKFATWVKEQYGSQCSESLHAQQWIKQTTGTKLRMDVQSFHHCRLVGECLMDSTDSDPHHSSTEMKAAEIDENRIKIMAIP